MRECPAVLCGRACGLVGPFLVLTESVGTTTLSGTLQTYHPMISFRILLRFAFASLLGLAIASVTHAADTTPPPAPGNLRLLQLGPTPNRVAIQWDAVTDT